MKKPHPVLRALNILGLEEILNLAKVLQSKKATMKKAAGEELVLWDEPTKQEKQPEPATVLPFLKKPREVEELKEEPKKEGAKEEAPSNLLSTDLMLWQKEISKGSEESLQKLDAFKGYSRATEMYVVKTQTNDGKEKIRFASTNGVLVNKKQA